MSNSLYTCNCDVIHEDIVNDVKGKMQPFNHIISALPPLSRGKVSICFLRFVV